MIAGTVILASVAGPAASKAGGREGARRCPAIAVRVDRGQAASSNAMTMSTKVEA
jgi:hypothetical protein